MEQTSVTPTSTANGKFHFSSVYFGKPLSSWIGLIDRTLQPGSYGYDSVAVSVASALSELLARTSKYGDPVHDMAEAAHRGWCENYLYWRHRRPWLTHAYKKTAEFVNDISERACLVSYSELSGAEQRRYLDMAKTVLKSLGY